MINKAPKAFVSSQERAERFEVLYTAYINKLCRLDDLQVAGRYGFQLRMPKKALHIAMENLRAFGREYGVEVESLFGSVASNKVWQK